MKRAVGFFLMPSKLNLGFEEFGSIKFSRL